MRLQDWQRGVYMNLIYLVLPPPLDVGTEAGGGGGGVPPPPPPA
jgi:hypothetical protein